MFSVLVVRVFYWVCNVCFLFCAVWQEFTSVLLFGVSFFCTIKSWRLVIQLTVCCFLDRNSLLHKKLSCFVCKYFFCSKFPVFCRKCAVDILWQQAFQEGIYFYYVLKNVNDKFCTKLVTFSIEEAILIVRFDHF